MAKNKNAVICVFCGSSPGTSPSHMSTARSLAETFHKYSISLVYGGGTVGLMGELARTLVTLSGPDSVHGVIPEALLPLEASRREGEHLEGNNINETSQKSQLNIPTREVFGNTTLVPDMHTRKRTMARLVGEGGPGSGFCALSGGYGTLEELMEIVTWNQLGIHQLGITVLNVDGYWDGILKWINDAVQAGFIRGSNKDIVVEARSAEDVVVALRNYMVSEGRYKLNWGDEGKGSN